MGIDYKTAGVDTEAGDQLVDWLQSDEHAQTQNAQKTIPHFDRIVSGIGGFASLFDIRFPEMKKPLLITCTDGVGTKVKLASHFQDYSGVGQDLVAMCVNDLVCTGGIPLLFLDYYATGRLHLPSAKAFLSGVRTACLESNCALVGGETAEMPGVYHDGDFDCAGFAVGVVDEEKSWGPQRVQSGDVLVGVSSSGFHSNGYSLLRKVFADSLEAFKNILLKPTALYVKLVADVGKSVQVHAAAHITGGGIENLPRVVPKHLTVEMNGLWKFPQEFMEVQYRTGLSDFEMLKTLNCGIGFVFFVAATDVAKARAIIESMNFKSFELGKTVERTDDRILNFRGIGELCEPRS